MTLALKATRLAKTFGPGKGLVGRSRPQVHAVLPTDLAVKPGETLGIVGESGCGKSTLARMLVGLLAPSSGTIEIEGLALNRADPVAFGRLIQFVFQDPVASLNPRLKIRQMIEAPLTLLHGMGQAARAARVAEIMAQLNLSQDYLDRYAHELSGGQAQRVAIARTLAASPRILVLDEPVSALDVSVQAQVLNILLDLKASLGLTYIFISHNLAVIEAISDRVAVMYFGSVVEIGPASGLLAAPRHPYTRLLLDSAPALGRPLARATEGELPDPLNPPPGCAFAGRCPRVSQRCRVETPELAPGLTPIEDDHLAACHHPLTS